MTRKTCGVQRPKCLRRVSDKLCGASFGGSRNTLHIGFFVRVSLLVRLPVDKTQVNARVWCTPLGAFVRHACALFFLQSLPGQLSIHPVRQASASPKYPSCNQRLESEGSPFRPPAMPRRQWGTPSHARLSTPNCDSKPCCRVLSNFGRSPWAFNCVCLPPIDHMPQAPGTRWPQQR